MHIIKENIVFKTDERIWGIKHNQAADVFGLEIKNPAKQTTAYHIIKTNGKSLAIYTPEEKWYITLEELTDNELIVSTFHHSETPTRKDIILFPFNNKNKPIKIIENTSIVAVTDGVLQYQLNGKESENGSIAIGKTNEEHHILFPFHYNHESPHLKTVQHFLKQTLNKEAVLCADYWENDKYLVISYFCQENNQLNAYMLLCDNEGNPIHQIILEQNASGIAFDTFFITNNTLFYITNKKILNAISL